MQLFYYFHDYVVSDVFLVVVLVEVFVCFGCYFWKYERVNGSGWIHIYLRLYNDALGKKVL